MPQHMFFKCNFYSKFINYSMMMIWFSHFYCHKILHGIKFSWKFASYVKNKDENVHTLFLLGSLFVFQTNLLSLKVCLRAGFLWCCSEKKIKKYRNGFYRKIIIIIVWYDFVIMMMASLPMLYVMINIYEKNF